MSLIPPNSVALLRPPVEALTHVVARPPETPLVRLAMTAGANLAWSVLDATRARFFAPRLAAGSTGAGAQVVGMRAPEVERAARTYAPRLGSLAKDDAARGRMLVQEALSGLDLRIAVTRWSATTDAFLAGAEPWLATIHGTRPQSAVMHGKHAIRALREQVRGIHGDGPRAGKTVYASLRFASPSEAHAAARGGGAGRGPLAITPEFGDSVLELSTDVLARTTMSAGDTGLGLAPMRVAPIERLADVVLERLARSHGFVGNPLNTSGAQARGMGQGLSSAERQADLLEVLRSADATASIGRIRSYLTSDALASADGFIELQVRGVQRADVVAVHGPASLGGAVDGAKHLAAS